ncbi:MAG: hypothetical protein EA416_10580 [Trueperaceae bacterium]|nr:MAG: hypothetical protein EA416_10580 [Trueperaceae bacterium]
MNEILAMFDLSRLDLTLFDGVSWWSVALAAALVVRALAVLSLGANGAAWRGVLAVVIGALAVAQLALEGPSVALLPLHAAAALVVALLPWERPHPEPPRLILGRNRHRRARPPRLRATLALLLVLAVAAWTFLAPA